MQIDETDRALIAALQANARQPIADLARTLGLARTTVQARLDRLERNGTIIGYTARLSAAADAPLHATALVSIEPRTGPAVLARLRSLPGVRVVHTTSGRFDLLVQIAATTTEELDETLDKIGEARGVKSSESLIHLSTKLDRRS
ncbi:MAG: Lrp/AsnC family transcriptional regulator [Sulfitobacter sp.]